MARRFGVRLGAVALVGLAVRWIAVLVHYRHLSPPPADLTDNTWYWLQANLLADGHGFANPIYWWRDGVIRHSAGHPPLYTAYLAIFSFVGLDSPLSMRLASGLLGAATVAVIGLATRQITNSDRTALLAAGVAALYPQLWMNDALILSESLYALLVAALLLTTYQLIQAPSVGRAAVVGAVVGLACLTRSESQLYFVTLLPLATLWCLRREAWAQRLRLLGAAVLIGLLVTSPWVVKNLTTFEHPVFLAIGAGFVLEVSNCEDTYHGDLLGYWSDRCGSGWAAPGTRGCDEVISDGPGAGDRRGRPALICDESVIELVKRERATQFISEHRGRLPLVMAARVGRIWNLYRPLQGVDLDRFFERRDRLGAITGLWSFYALGILAGVGAVTMWRRRIPLAPLVAILAIVTFTAATTMGITRYRVGAEVVWVILAAVGVEALWSRWRSTAAIATPEASSNPTSAVER